MESREIDEALKSLKEIKKLFAERTREELKGAKHQFLVWGAYQIILPLVVYYTRAPIYFLLLLPIFFFLSQIKRGDVLKPFIWWTFTLLVYFFLARLNNPIFFYAFVIVSIFIGFWITREKSSSQNAQLSTFFWTNTIIFGFLFQFVLFHTKDYNVLFFSWPAIMLSAVGFLGAFGETSLFVLYLIGNIIGAVYFCTVDYAVFTPAVYGIMYIIYYIYISLRLARYHG